MVDQNKSDISAVMPEQGKERQDEIVGYIELVIRSNSNQIGDWDHPNTKPRAKTVIKEALKLWTVEAEDGFISYNEFISVVQRQHELLSERPVPSVAYFGMGLRSVESCKIYTAEVDGGRERRIQNRVWVFDQAD